MSTCVSEDLRAKYKVNVTPCLPIMMASFPLILKIFPLLAVIMCNVQFLSEKEYYPPPAPTVARKPSKPGEKTELPDSQYVLIYGKSTCSLAHKDVLNGAVGKHWNLRL